MTNIMWLERVFWWNLGDISRFLNRRAQETSCVKELRENRFEGKALGEEAVESRVFLVRSGEEPPKSVLRSEKDRDENVQLRLQDTSALPRATLAGRRRHEELLELAPTIPRFHHAQPSLSLRKPHLSNDCS